MFVHGTLIDVQHLDNYIYSEPLLTDADLFRQRLDSSLFPGIPSGVEVHHGFADAHKECVVIFCYTAHSGTYLPTRTAKDVLAAVQQTMQAHNTTKVTVVGHSLGMILELLCIYTTHLARQRQVVQFLFLMLSFFRFMFLILSLN
jgi:pimeloyl-ACP methyl ester carboxylesterase